MVYIITSKTRRRLPHGRTMQMTHRETGEVRITDERYADRLKRHNWDDPEPIRRNGEFREDDG